MTTPLTAEELLFERIALQNECKSLHASLAVVEMKASAVIEKYASGIGDDKRTMSAEIDALDLALNALPTAQMGTHKPHRQESDR